MSDTIDNRKVLAARLREIGEEYERSRALMLRRVGARVTDPESADLHEWAVGRFDLGLSDAEAGALTPREFYALMERRAVELESRHEKTSDEEPQPQELSRLRDEAGLTQGAEGPHAERIKKLETFKQARGLSWDQVCEMMGTNGPRVSSLRDYRGNRIHGKVSSPLKTLIDGWIDTKC